MTLSIRTVAVILGLALAIVAAPGFIRPAQDKIDETPRAVVATYESLADAILAVKATEANLVRSMLEGGHAHAKSLLGQARYDLDAGKKDEAKEHIEALAAVVAQLGAEGDNAIAGVRKRLLEGGHHYNAEGEEQGVFEPGYVIVTREAKEKLLGVATAMRQATTDEARQKAWSDFEAASSKLLDVD